MGTRSHVSIAAAAAVAVAAGALVRAPAAHAAGYTLQALDASRDVRAMDVNDAGEVTGCARFRDGDFVFRYSGGVLRSLSPRLLFDQRSCGEGINAAGAIAGTLGDIDGFERAFAIFPDRTFPDLVREFGAAHDLNDSGQVAGAGQAFANRHAFLWRRDGFRDLGTLGGADSEATATAAAGQAAGFAELPDGRAHAFLFTSGHMRDLGTLGGRQSEAFGVNAQNHVVGDAGLRAGGRRAFLWTPAAGMRNLGVLAPRHASFAHAVNASDTVVGSARTPAGDHAFVWRRSGGMQDLNSLVPAASGVVLFEAVGVNASGQIVANGVLDGSVATAFLLTPT